MQPITLYNTTLRIMLIYRTASVPLHNKGNIITHHITPYHAALTIITTQVTTCLTKLIRKRYCEIFNLFAADNNY